MEPQQQDKRQHKERLYALFAQMTGAMANPHRLELLDLLAQAPRTVEELAHEAAMSLANTSQHLQRLKQARLVISERKGLYIRYRLADPEIARLWMSLRRVAHAQLAEVEQVLEAYRSRRHEFETISAGALQKRLEAGEAFLLDVRPAAEYDAGHLPGAVSLPLDDIDERLGDLPRDRLAVAYCRGPYCVYADEALVILAENGWKVARLEEGILEWNELGLPLSERP